MADRFNQKSIDLSKLLFDPVSLATANGNTYTADQRTLALNEAEKIIIAKIGDEMKFEELARKIPVLLDEADVAIAVGVGNVPAGAVKVYRCAESNYTPLVYTELNEWYGVLNGVYNTEQNDTTYNKRWTTFGGKIKVLGNLTTVKAIYLKDHVDLTPASSGDFIVPARYDPELLTLAHKFISELLTIK